MMVVLSCSWLALCGCSSFHCFGRAVVRFLLYVVVW